MKIVAHDNFDRDNVSEWLVAENIKHADDADVMCKALNDAADVKYNNRQPWYFSVKPDDYKLYVWEP